MFDPMSFLLFLATLGSGIGVGPGVDLGVGSGTVGVGVGSGWVGVGVGSSVWALVRASWVNTKNIGSMLRGFEAPLSCSLPDMWDTIHHCYKSSGYLEKDDDIIQQFWEHNVAHKNIEDIKGENYLLCFNILCQIPFK